MSNNFDPFGYHGGAGSSSYPFSPAEPENRVPDLNFPPGPDPADYDHSHALGSGSITYDPSQGHTQQYSSQPGSSSHYPAPPYTLQYFDGSPHSGYEHSHGPGFSDYYPHHGPTQQYTSQHDSSSQYPASPFVSQDVYPQSEYGHSSALGSGSDFSYPNPGHAEQYAATPVSPSHSSAPPTILQALDDKYAIRVYKHFCDNPEQLLEVRSFKHLNTVNKQKFLGCCALINTALAQEATPWRIFTVTSSNITRPANRYVLKKQA